MTTLRIILNDQLSTNISSLHNCNKATDVVFMCEAMEEVTYVQHHKKKIAFLFSAMRHFANDLQIKGFNVHYTKLDHPDNSGSLSGEIQQVIKSYGIQRVIITKPGEYRILKNIEKLSNQTKVPIQIFEDTRFICSHKDFEAWSEGGKKSLRMEFFYRHMRQKHQILMDGDQPIGGQWNFDASNRKKPSDHTKMPNPYHARIDKITNDVIGLVQEHFPKHFGDLEPFHFAVTRQQALRALNHFMKNRLPQFGDYQDAMLEGEPWMFHAHIAFYLNCGLLLPIECIHLAEQAYHDGQAPLNAVEGFIRQILGWREFIRGVYWLKMPDYATRNFFRHKRALPNFYWTGETKMNCVKQCVLDTKRNAYAHHIQRLMVLGNFALLAGIDPKEVNEWFLIVYADAYEWVELPNVSGMALFADGGMMSSKPYASGGAYIHKMSNYCKRCHYQVNQKNGDDACPFNYLYWDFLSRNHSKLANNHRLRMIYKTLDQMDAKKKNAIQTDSRNFLNELDNQA